MEITTLQQRLESKAKRKLERDLYDACLLEHQVRSTLGNEYEPRLAVRHITHGGAYSTPGYYFDNDYTKAAFDRLLPKYIENITDELLNKIAEIDYLVSQNKSEELI